MSLLFLSTFVAVLLSFAFVIFTFLAMLSKIVDITEDIKAIRDYQAGLTLFVAHNEKETVMAISDISQAVLHLLPDENITQEVATNDTI